MESVVVDSKSDVSRDALLAAYGEICKSYHAIDDFRMKLLGSLPLASLVGIILLDVDKLLTTMPLGISTELIGFAAIFASALTLALFSYEIRGIRRCHNLITEGQHIEKSLGIGHGQFHVCAEEHKNQSAITAVSNAKFAACAIYSMVFAAWFFVGLRFGFQVDTYTCSAFAAVAAILIAAATYFSVRKLTAP